MSPVAVYLQSNDDFEPDEEWKSQLKKRIEDWMESMVREVKENLAVELREEVVTPETRRRIEDCKRAIDNIKVIASEQYQLELRRECEQRRLTAVVPLDPELCHILSEEQQRIMDTIQVGKDATGSPTGVRRIVSFSRAGITRIASKKPAHSGSQAISPPKPDVLRSTVALRHFAVAKSYIRGKIGSSAIISSTGSGTKVQPTIFGTIHDRVDGSGPSYELEENVRKPIIAGALNIDGNPYPIPMAATDTLIDSISPGFKALNASRGVTTVLMQGVMTCRPAIDFPSQEMATHAKAWVSSAQGYDAIKSAFESMSHAKLKRLKTELVDRTLFMRFIKTATEDALPGEAMISRGVKEALKVMKGRYPTMTTFVLPGTRSTDETLASTVNRIEEYGKSVVAEAMVPGVVVRDALKTTVEALVNLKSMKNSELAVDAHHTNMMDWPGEINDQTVNIVKAMFIVIGQDPTRSMESARCLMFMEEYVPFYLMRGQYFNFF